MKKNQGITLIALVITVIVLAILVSIATYSGATVIKSSKLTAFTTEMKIMQTQVNAIYQDNNKPEEYGEEIANAGANIQEQAEIVFKSEASGITEKEGYRYWSNAQIKELGIEGVEQDFFVNLSKRSIISYEGLKYEGKTYYMLSQLPQGLYNVEYEQPKVVEPIFDVEIEKIRTNKWRIVIPKNSIQYEGYTSKWQVRYKLQEKDYWNTTEDLSFVVNQAGVYKIQIANEGIESAIKEIKVMNEYVKEGLQLYYDGINNTRNGNDPEATSWEDLSGNNNDGVFYNINTDSSTITPTTAGYYSQEEKGYVFLQNDSYIQSTNKIGISGDNKYTIEVVSNMWEDGKNPNYTSYQSPQAAWWGSSSSTVGTSTVFSYNRNSKKIYNSFINHSFYSNSTYDLVGRINYLSYRKIKTGTIEPGAIDIGKINYNGQDVPSTYGGTATFTTDLIDSEVQVGRGWQYQNQNRTFYGSIQAVRIYNRTLTDEEIRINYETDKIRFDIQE